MLQWFLCAWLWFILKKNGNEIHIQHSGMEMNGRVYRKDKKEIMGFVCLFFFSTSVFQTWGKWMEIRGDHPAGFWHDSGASLVLLPPLQYSLVLANQPSMKHAYCWVLLLFYHFQQSDHRLQNWQNYRFLLCHIICFFKTSINLSWWVCIQRTEIDIDLCVTNLSYLFGIQNELW